MACCLCLRVLLCAALCAAEVIDRIAVTVGKHVITESELLREIRLTALLNGEQPDFGPDARRKTAERQVERALIRTEMEMSRYPMPHATEAEPMLKEVKQQRFRSEAEYRKALEKYGVAEAELRQHLLHQLATLRFIELRFRPGIQVLESEMRDYYEKRLLPEWDNKNRKKPPAFDEARAEIEELMIAERVDRLVDQWLKQARARTRIEYREKAFQ